MYQKIILIGNLGDDVTMRYTPSGVAVSSFSLAVNKTWSGQDGQKQDRTTWFRVTCWRKQAEIVSQYLKKGAKVMIEGEIEEARAYIDKKSGEARASLEVTASAVKFLSGRGDAPAEVHDDGGSAGYAPASSAQYGEDIPF